MENLNAEQIRYKMSEKHIIRALECLCKPNSSPDDREKCFFMWKEPSCFSCHHEVAQNALALITSQEQEKEKLGLLIDEIEKEKRKLFEENKRLTEENERLKKDNEYILMQHRFQRRPSGDCWNDVIKKAEADTVRKMQERLEEHFVEHN